MNFGLGLYILDADGKTPIPRADADEWAAWITANADKFQIGFTQHDAISVTTIFTGTGHAGLDHTGAVVPLVFETRVIGGRCNGEGEGYTTWEDAERGHAEHVHRAFWDTHMCPPGAG